MWDFSARFDEGLAQLLQWYRAGRLTSRVSTRQGFEQLPLALEGLFKGSNIGKQLVKMTRHAPISTAAANAASLATN